LVLTFLLVLMITHAGTGWFCLVFFISRFLRDVFLRAAIYFPFMDSFSPPFKCWRARGKWLIRCAMENVAWQAAWTTCTGILQRPLG
jgi:hypothetical protein